MAGPRVGGRGPHGMMPGEKAKDFKGTMGKLLTYLKKFLPSIILVLVCAAASTIFSIFGPKILGQATTKLLDRNRKHRLSCNRSDFDFPCLPVCNQCAAFLCTGMDYVRCGNQAELFDEKGHQ